MVFGAVAAMVVGSLGCGPEASREGERPGDVAAQLEGQEVPFDPPYDQVSRDTLLAVATFAGGCFWCMEPPFEKLDGVEAVVSGYAGGEEVDPSYEKVSSGSTGHVEAIQVFYDPGKVTYAQLLGAFWRSIDPTDEGGQFADRGAQYRTAIFYQSAQEKRLAEDSKRELEGTGPFDRPVVTPIRSFTTFYPAEDYHQDYYLKNPEHYGRYREGSGRGPFLRRVWGEHEDTGSSLESGDRSQGPRGFSPDAFVKPSEEVLRERLTTLQYRVTQEDGTERSFNNEYWDNEEPGIYVDVVSGEPLFASIHKYRSGSGWPSFTQPLVPENVVEESDFSLGMMRTEVRSRHADSHLGHVFEDGPQPTGLRYCMNSAALRFVPADELVGAGYGSFAGLFGDESGG